MLTCFVPCVCGRPTVANSTSASFEYATLSVKRVLRLPVEHDVELHGDHTSKASMPSVATETDVDVP